MTNPPVNRNIVDGHYVEIFLALIEKFHLREGAPLLVGLYPGGRYARGSGPRLKPVTTCTSVRESRVFRSGTNPVIENGSKSTIY